MTAAGIDSRPVAVVTGAHGQLGSAICEELAGDFEVVPFIRATVDITDGPALIDRVVGARPAVIVNCAAYNDVDGAQENAQTAFEVNGLAVRSLARAAERADAMLVHYSTDFVFDGNTDRPYTEDDRPSPLGIYGQSKLVGEWMAASTPRHYVLRVESLFGGPQTRSSVDRVIDAVRAHREVRVFHDREVSPSFVDDVVDATRYLIEHEPPHGLYHCVNSGHATWLELGRETVKLLGLPDSQLTPVSVHDVALKVPRPRYAALDNQKLTRAGFHMPAWQDALARYLARQEP
jgi:dTDP-4-dehydrorhamnose reductase